MSVLESKGIAFCVIHAAIVMPALIWSFTSVGNYDYSIDQALVKTLKGPRVQYHNLNVFKLKLISHPLRLRGPKLV